MNKFDDNLLESKKFLFNKFVNDACKYYGLDNIFQINNIDGYKPDNTRAIAWIEPITKIICISLIHLREMHIEDIRKTAFHEITHMFYEKHETPFRNLLNDALVETWEPFSTSGMKMIKGNTVKPKFKTEPLEIDMVKCNYHLHREEAELKQCPYCRNYYCDLHIRPKQSHSFNPNEPDRDYTGHPCYYFYLYDNEDVEIKSKYNENCKRLLEFRRFAKEAYKKQEEREARKQQLAIEMENSQAIICSKCRRKFHKLTNEQYQENEKFKIVNWSIVPQWDSDGSIQCPHCKDKIIPDEIVD